MWPLEPGRQRLTERPQTAAQHLPQRRETARHARGRESSLYLAGPLLSRHYLCRAHTNSSPDFSTTKDASRLLPSNYVPSTPPREVKTGGVANPTYRSKLLWDCNCAYTPTIKIALPLRDPAIAQRYRIYKKQAGGAVLEGNSFFCPDRRRVHHAWRAVAF